MEGLVMPRRQGQIAKPSGGVKTAPDRALPLVASQDAPVPFTSTVGNQAANAVMTSAVRQGRSNLFNEGPPRLANPGASVGAGRLVHSAVGDSEPEKAHEHSANRASARPTAKASSVRVSGGTATRVTRKPKDETKHNQPSLAAKLDASLEAKDPAGSLPKEDAARALQPGPEYWLSHLPDVEGMGAVRLFDEFNQVDEWIKRQTATTPDLARLERVRDQLQSEKDKRQKRTEDAGKKMPQRAAKAAGNRGKKTDDRAAADAPRILRERSSIATTEAGDLRREYDEIAAYLQRKDIAPDDRKLLQTELATLGPAVTQHLTERSAQRHAEVISRALTPDASSGDIPGQLVEAVRRVDSIRPISDHPGLSYLMHGHEMIVIPDATANAIRANTLNTLDQTALHIIHANDETQADYGDLLKRSFEKHPVVGFISSYLSGENPADWEQKLIPMVGLSNQQRGQFRELRRASNDPWRTDRPNLSQMAEKVAAAQRFSDNARNYLDYKTGRLMSGTKDAIGYLERSKLAGQIAANFAFSPAGAALYGATESTLEQTSEIAYGDRAGYDWGGIAIDALASYGGGKFGGFVGGKLSQGVLSFGGKSAPAWVRGAAGVAGVVGGGRAGAAATTAIGLGLNRTFGRRDASASEIAGAVGREIIDLKGSLGDLAMGAVGHTVSARARPSSSWLGRKLLIQPPPRRLPAAVSPASPAAEVGKTSGPTGPADVPTALGQSPPTTETHPRSAADVAPTASSAGNIHPPSRSTPTRLGTRVLEAVIRGRLQADPSIRGISAGDFKPTPALTEHTAPKAGGLSPAETPDPSALSPAPTNTKSSEPTGTPKQPADKTGLREPSAGQKSSPAPASPEARSTPATQADGKMAAESGRAAPSSEIATRQEQARTKRTRASTGAVATKGETGSTGATVAKGKPRETEKKASTAKTPRRQGVGAKGPIVGQSHEGKAVPQGNDARTQALDPTNKDPAPDSSGTPDEKRVRPMKQAGRKPPETFDSPSHTEAEPSGPAEAAGSGEPYFELERDDDLRAIAAADEERDPAEDESPRLREKSRTLQRRQEREYAQRGIKETAASRAKRKLTEMQATAKSGQYSSSHSKTKRRLLKQYKDVLRDAQLPQITKNKLQGSFDEALRTPRTDRLGDPQSKYVAGSPELPFHDLPAGEASYAQPDYSKRKPQPEGGAQRVHANLKSDSLQDLTVAQARAKAKAHTDQAVRNAHHLPEGERIIIDYADTPSPEAREAMRQQFFRPNSPIEEVRFGNSVIRRSDPLSAGGKSSGTGVGGASRPAPMATPKKNPSPVSSRSTGRKTPAPNKKTRVKTPKIKPQAPVRKKPTPGASKSKGERIKDDAPVPVDPASSRGDRVTEALGEPDTVLGAARDYQQYKTEGRSEAEALSRSATTLAANLAGGPAGNVVNTGNPDQLLPAAKQIIKDKWNKLWS